MNPQSTSTRKDNEASIDKSQYMDQEHFKITEKRPKKQHKNQRKVKETDLPSK